MNHSGKLSMNQTPQVDRLLNAAGQARQSGDMQASKQHLSAALKLAPNDPRIFNAQGMQALAENNPVVAAAQFQRAASLDPSAPELWMNVARAQRLLQDDEGERASLTQALAADQLHFMAWLRKAQLHQRLGENPQAVQAWQMVLTQSTTIDPIAPDLSALLNGATEFVRTQNIAFADAIEKGMGTTRKKVAVQDSRRFNACIDKMLGRRSIFTNECAGVHFPFLPADEFFERHHFPWLSEIEAKTDIIRAEFLALLETHRTGLRPYVKMDAGTPHNKWTALDGSLDWGAYFLWEYGVPQQAACEACPQTAAALAALPTATLPGRAPTAFFSLLKPHTRIPPHTGVTNTRAIIHLPLIVPEGCGFRVGGETRHWKVGEAFAFDDTIEHEAWNDSDELRAVLIFDVWNPHITQIERDLLREFFTVADKSGFDPQVRSQG
jgi:aspartate beta-hydroxylase